MNVLQTASYVFKNTFNYRGRARRREYWMFYLFNALVIPALAIMAALLSALLQSESLMGLALIIPCLYSSISAFPSFSLMVRRLHDTGKPGAYFLFVLIPIVGEILLLVWILQEGDVGPNRYGADPKATPVPPAAVPKPASRPDPAPRYGVRPEESAPAALPEKKAGWVCACGSFNSEKFGFCTECGAVRPKEPAPAAPPEKPAPVSPSEEKAVSRCSACGAPIDPGKTLCPSCWMKKREELDAAPPEPDAPVSRVSVPRSSPEPVSPEPDAPVSRVVHSRRAPSGTRPEPDTEAPRVKKGLKPPTTFD